MAIVKKHISKTGKVTYYIRTYDGYDSNGKQIERSTTWKTSDNMTSKQIEKELKRQVILFEESVKNGSCFDSNTRFADYAEKWLENNKPPQLAPKTYERYKSLLKNINTAIGHIKLVKLQYHHLQEFYNNLRENGIKRVGAYASSDKISEILISKSFSRKRLAELSGLSSTTISSACKSERISTESAEKIAEALKMPVNQLFNLHTETTGLSSKTILHHHRLISSILAQAARDRIVPINIADKNYMKAPKLERKEANFLDDEQVKQVLELLNNEPIKWKTAIYLLIFSGMRRGELLGLEWSDIDFDNQVIHICNTSQYVQGMGIITKCPKNDTSQRTIKLSPDIFDLLNEYHSYWRKMRKDLADKWQYFIEITLADGTKKTVRNERLFIKDDSTPMHPDSLTDWTKKFVEKNKLPHFSPHSLRHTHASILIPSNLKTIGYQAFWGCTSFSGTDIPTSVKTIGAGSFINCANLESIVIPNNVKVIGDSAFKSCNNLQYLTISDSVTEKSNDVFENCNIKTITIADGSEAITSTMTGGFSNVEKIIIPESVTTIEDYAFSGCQKLTDIKIPESVTSIGNCIFNECKELESIEIPDSVTQIGGGVFYGCTNLTSVKLPDTTTSLDYYDDYGFFEECTSLKTLTIPSNLKTIGDNTFYNCLAMKRITIRNTKCDIYDSEYTIPKSITICGYDNSTAKKYADAYGNSFEVLEEIIGDINGDGKISVADIVLLQNALVKKGELTPEMELNGNNKINVFDLIILKRKVIYG